jgi:prophage tail gpP-like protein
VTNEVWDVGSWIVVADEQAGVDAKDWLTPPDA